MSKKKKTILLCIGIFILINIIASFPVSGIIMYNIMKGKGNEDTGVEAMTAVVAEKYDGFDASSLDSYLESKVTIDSSLNDGHVIPLWIYRSESNATGNSIVMAHGMNSSHVSEAPIIKMFLDEGLDVYIYDQRGFGESTDKTMSYGYFESSDLLDAFKYANEDKKNDSIIGVWGCSMGGAAVCNVMDEEYFKEYADFIILDCPMGCMGEVTGAPEFQNKMGSLFWKINEGFTFDDQSPYHQIKDNTIPVLLITAQNDTVIKKATTDAIADGLYNCDVTKYEGAGSKHAWVYKDHPDDYSSEVHKIVSAAVY